MRAFTSISVLLFAASISVSATTASGSEPELPPGQVISAGLGYDTCAVSELGEARCWGYNWQASGLSPDSVPNAWEKVVEISSGGTYWCAVTALGQAKCWGANNFGEREVPQNLGKIIQISAGGYHTCAVTESKLVRCWGASFPIGVGVPSDLGQVEKISASLNYTCAVTIQSEVRCWGDSASAVESNIPSDLGKISQVSAAFYHACVLTVEQKVKCWGTNSSGETDVPSDLGRVKLISAGGSHTCAVKLNGEVVCWGWNAFGQTNVPAGLGDVKQISAGAYHTCAVTGDGFARCWGYNRYGESSLPKLPLGKLLLPLTQVKTPKPLITGTGNVGEVLTANVGEWDPGVRLGYKWLRDGEPIFGASEMTYRIRPEDYSHELSLEVTGFKENVANVSNQSLPVNVGAGTISRTETPSISGSEIVGGTLQITNLDSWDNGTQFSYQWLRNNIEIAGATNAYYKLGVGDFGKDISVRITGSKYGYIPVSLVSEATKVARFFILGSPCGYGAQGILSTQLDESQGIPSILGVGRVGQSLKASPGTWESGTKFCTFWISGETAIPLSKTNSYKLQGSDLDREVRAVVIGTKSGISTAKISEPTFVSKSIFAKAKKPIVKGLPRVGVKITASVSSWETGVTYKYNWMRDGEPLEGASGLIYTPGPTDAGSELYFRVCGSKTLYEEMCLDSEGQSVQLGVISKVGNVSIRGTSTNPGALLTGVTTQWMSGATLYSQWLLNGVPIPGATTPQILVSPSFRGGALTYQVTGALQGYQSVVKSSSAKIIR